jgi:AcrR family transcriptional regulator
MRIVRSNKAMTLSTAGEKGWRGSLEGWLDAAYEAFVDSGVEAVRILPLAKKLKVSRTSFYWFFKDREALLAALLDQWREKNTGNFRKQAESYAESITEAIFNVFDCWLDPRLFDSKLEFAVRSWAQQSPKVASEIKIADAYRLESLTNMFIRFGYENHAADVRARTIYLTQIGYISMKTKEDLATRMRRIPEYVEIFTGTAALPRELERFFARHGFVPKKTAPVTTRNNKMSRTG